MSTRLRCDDCGFTTNTTSGHAAYALRKHSCDRQRARDARAERVAARKAASGPVRDCHCPQADHQHGTRAAYVVDKCRCRECRASVATYERNRRRQRAYGRAAYVPADAARAHVQQLRDQGMGWKRVAHASGLGESVIWKLIYGDPNRGQAPCKRIRPATEQAILGVRLDVAAGGRVDPTGSMRRLQALTVLGWSIGQLTDRFPYDRQRLDAAINGRTVVQSTADAVRDLYDALWDQAPPETNQRERIAATRARSRGRAAGWAPPMAWDDDTIDDPTALPQLGDVTSHTNRRSTVHPDDVEFLIDQGHGALDLATRLGVQRDSVYAALKRADRLDLWDRASRIDTARREGAA